MADKEAESGFNVMIQVDCHDGHPLELIKREIVKLTNGDEDRIENLLTGNPEIIATTPAQETAEIYCDLLRAKDIYCWVEAE